jgi:hypothetical protein
MLVVLLDDRVLASVAPPYLDRKIFLARWTLKLLIAI